MSNTSTFISKGVASNLTTLSLSPTLSSFHGGGASSYAVDVGSFNYDAYGNGLAFRKDTGPIDAYINSIIALGNLELIWTFTPTSGTPFNRLIYPIASNNSLGPLDASADIWTLSTQDSTPLQGTGTNQLNFNTFPNGTIFNIKTKATSSVLMGGWYNTPGDPSSGGVGGTPFRTLIPTGTYNLKMDYNAGDERVFWNGIDWYYTNTTLGILAASSGGGDFPWEATWPSTFTAAEIPTAGGNASTYNVDRAHFVYCIATSDTTTVRVTDENGGTLGEFYLHSIGDSVTIEKSPSDYVVLVSGGAKVQAIGSPGS
jgi:hypothetical protein